MTWQAQLVLMEKSMRWLSGLFVLWVIGAIGGSQRPEVQP